MTGREKTVEVKGNVGIGAGYRRERKPLGSERMTVVLMAQPVLRNLVENYEALSACRPGRPGHPAASAENAETAETRRRMEDVAYTLCVSTGTRDIQSALAVARRQLHLASPR